MTGPEPARRWAGPVPLAQLLRAAITEAEANQPSGPGGPPAGAGGSTCRPAATAT